MDTCCGYSAAIVAAIAFGSFAVPIKTGAVRKVDVDPLVLQTYKIIMCLVTSWLVLLVPTHYGGVNLSSFEFTPWGFVSGLFMVPGGTAGYYAVRNAGITISQGIWSSLKVLVAFVWGILIFHEPIRSLPVTLFAVALLVTGLSGMSYYASTNSSTDSQSLLSTSLSLPPSPSPGLSSLQTDEETCRADGRINSLSMGEIESQRPAQRPRMNINKNSVNNTELFRPLLPGARNDDDHHQDERNGPVPAAVEDDDAAVAVNNSHSNSNNTGRRRALLGVMGAVIDGAYGGSVLVPMHYAKTQHHVQGLSYVVSFAIGCTAVLAVVWIMRYLYACVQAQSLGHAAVRQLPSFHLCTVGSYAMLAGIIWSIGNLSSIVSVTILGQGIGYTIVQSQLLVAGLWGTAYFREIRDGQTIFKWFTFAGITVAGILLLSREHVSSTGTVATIKQ